MITSASLSLKMMRHFEHRLADHPGHGHRAQHQWQEEHHPKELSRTNLRIEQQGKSKGNHVLDADGEYVVHHVLQGVPVERVVPHLSHIVQTIGRPVSKANCHSAKATPKRALPHTKALPSRLRLSEMLSVVTVCSRSP